MILTRQKEDLSEDDEVLSTPVPKMVIISASNNSKNTNNNNKSGTITTVRTNDAFSPSTPTPSKQILENNRKKRRSSLAVVAAAAQNSVRNSFGAAAPSLQSQLPPSNVKTTEYHRHLQPDLPGPVKMRQLMIWACQKAATSQHDKLISSKLVDSLINNELSTSWYQRPNNVMQSENNIYYLPNPQNQELLECIELYKNYHMKLQKECEIWEQFKENPTCFKPQNIMKISSSDVKIDNTLNVFFAEEFQTLNKWLTSLPLSIDRLDWNTKLALSFQDHAKQFCEGVFHQIFAKFFSSDLSRGGKAQRIEPMMILRALSTNTSSN